MDFGGLLGMEVFLGSSPTTFSPSVASELESIRKRSLFGSHFLRQGRSTIAEEDEWRCPKIARSSCAEQMLSFSSSKTSSLMHISDSPSASAPSPPSSAAPSRVWSSSGLNHGGLNVNMKGAMRGPFTLFQRMELEQQILIYSYIRANVPIPTNLLFSLRRGLNPAGFSACPTGAFRPNAAWWGYINPCLVGNADAEPGRCRRTDGKKWRCSRDAVLDQKYCERHINRGRHRSRKPVEGHSGHARKAVTIIADPTSASAGPCGSQSSNSLADSRHQIKNLNATIDTSPSQLWMVAGGNSVNDHPNSAQDPSILASAANSFDSCLTSKNYSPLEGASPLALDSGNGLLSQLGGSFATHNSFVTALELHDNKSQQSHKLGPCIDDWLPSQSDCTTIIWPDSSGLPSKRTQPSVPFPMTSSDFSSSTSSPAPERLSPLHMGLGLGGIPNELNSVPHGYTGGPLGEALTSTSSTAVDENESFLSLMNDGWDLSPQLASSASNAMHSTPLSSVSSGSASDVMVEKHSAEDFNCRFGRNNAKSTNFPPL